MSQTDRSPETTMAAALQQRNVARLREPYVFRRFVEDAWLKLDGWFGRAKGDPAERRKIADLCYSVMSRFSGMSDASMRVLAQIETGWSEQHVAQIRLQKATVIDQHVEIRRFYDEVAERNSQFDAAERAVVQQRAADFQAKSPERLLAKLRSDGIRLALDGNALTAPAGSVLSAADRAEIGENKAGIVALLKAEAAERPMVIA